MAAFHYLLRLSVNSILYVIARLRPSRRWFGASVYGFFIVFVRTEYCSHGAKCDKTTSQQLCLLLSRTEVDDAKKKPCKCLQQHVK
jgi:hypothetical protein